MNAQNNSIFLRENLSLDFASFTANNTSFEYLNDLQSLLNIALVNILQGLPNRALKVLGKAASIAVYPQQKITILHLKWLAYSYQFNLFPNNNGASSVELESHWSATELLEEINAEITKLGGNPLQAQTFWEKIYFNLLPRHQSNRSVFQKQWHDNDATKEELFQQMVEGVFANEINWLHQAGIGAGMTAYLGLFQTELYVRAGKKEQAFHGAGQVEQLFQQIGDQGGVGLAHLMAGDIASTSILSPLVWGFSISESTGTSFSLDWREEQIEFRPEDADWEMALKHYNYAENIFDANNIKRGQAQIALRYAYHYLLKKDYKNAENQLDQALRIFEQTEDFYGFFLSKTQFILLQIIQGSLVIDLEEALREIGQWGKNQGSYSFAIGLGIFMTRVGRYWEVKLGEFETAMRIFQAVSILFKSLDANNSYIRTLFATGNTLKSLGNTVNAFIFYEKGMQALDNLVENGQLNSMSFYFVANAYQELYHLYLTQMDGANMIKTAKKIEQVITPFANVGQRDDYMVQMMQLAMKEALIPQVWQGKILGLVYEGVKKRKAGLKGQAQQLFDQAWQQAEQAQLDDATKEEFKFLVLANQKRYNEAWQQFQVYQKYQENSFKKTKQILNQGGLDAQSVAQKLENDSIKSRLENTFLMLIRIKRFKTAYSYIQKLEQQFGKEWWKNSDAPWKTLANLGELYEGLENYDLALQYYEKAIQFLENSRSKMSKDELKSGLGGQSDVQFLYFNAAKAALKQQLHQKNENNHFVEKALLFIEQNKSRTLFDMLSLNASFGNKNKKGKGAIYQWRSQNAKLRGLRNLLAAEYKNQQQQPQRIAFLEKQIQDGEDILKKLEKRLTGSEFGDLMRNKTANLPTVDECAKYLPSNTLLIEYALLREDLLIWTIDQNGLKSYHLIEKINEETINLKIQAFHHACSGKEKAWKLYSRELSVLFIKPIQHLLTDYKHLIFVPYGAMHQIPFQALLLEEKPLFFQFQISYLPSLGILPLLKRSHRSNQPKVLSVGNPALMSWQAPEDSIDKKPMPYSGLKYAEQEAELVADIFSDALLLTGSEATESRVEQLMENFDVLHFATHAVLSKESPLSSGILLANGEALTVYEFMNVKLKAELVVLSACQTGEGVVTGGDDVFGFTRGLLAAGTKSALVSLWQIDDLSTNLLISKFFYEYKNGKSLAEALRLAQSFLYHHKIPKTTEDFNQLDQSFRTMTRGKRGVGRKPRKSTEHTHYSHPYYWGAFTLVGL